MKRKVNLLIATMIVAMFILNGSNTPVVATSHAREYPTGLKILVYYDDLDRYHDDYKNIAANYSAAGNTITVVSGSNWAFDDATNKSTFANYDALFFGVWGSNITNAVTNANVTEIVSWFNTGDKLLWVGSDSDFGGSWIANRTNPLLEAIGTPLRFDAGAISDPQSKDGASYRVVANETGVSSNFVDNVTAGFTRMVFHGPTSINYYDSSLGAVTDLRNQTLPADIDIVINSSKAALALDQDVSLGDDDYYAYINTSSSTYHGNNGTYPMLATHYNASGVANGTSLLVVSGEMVYSDYKNMYGRTREKGKDNHDGSTIVDNIVLWYFATKLAGDTVIVHNRYITKTSTATKSVTETETETETSTVTNDVTVTSTTTESTPITIIAPIIAFVAISFYIRRKK